MRAHLCRRAPRPRAANQSTSRVKASACSAAGAHVDRILIDIEPRAQALRDVIDGSEASPSRLFCSRGAREQGFKKDPACRPRAPGKSLPWSAYPPVCGSRAGWDPVVRAARVWGVAGAGGGGLCVGDGGWRAFDRGAVGGGSAGACVERLPPSVWHG